MITQPANGFQSFFPLFYIIGQMKREREERWKKSESLKAPICPAQHFPVTKSSHFLDSNFLGKCMKDDQKIMDKDGEGCPGTNIQSFDTFNPLFPLFFHREPKRFGNGMKSGSFLSSSWYQGLKHFPSEICFVLHEIKRKYFGRKGRRSTWPFLSLPAFLFYPLLHPSLWLLWRSIFLFNHIIISFRYSQFCEKQSTYSRRFPSTLMSTY